MGRTVSNAAGKFNNLEDGLRHDTFESYANISHNINQSLLMFSWCLREVIEREAKVLQRGLHEVLYIAAGGVQQSFLIAPEVVVESVSLIVGHAKSDKSAKPGSLTAYLASRNQQSSRAKAAFGSESVSTGDTPQSSALVSSRATDSRDFPGQC